MKNFKTYAIDFDGTCTTHDYPNVGKDIGAVSVLKRLIDRGDKLILFTVRSGKEQQEAAKWFADNGLELYGIQYAPGQQGWTSSNKCYANIYIDDAALGAPLIYDPTFHNKPFIDWNKVEKILFDEQEKEKITNTSSEPIY